jgi:FKBP-type peptidyl-prolyl cis-trans isomerase SlyD
MRVGKDTVVTIHYHLTDPEGEVLHSSRGGEPLSYLHGYSGIIPGLESALEGRQAGEQLDAVVEPAQAYGVHDPDLDIAVPIEGFPEEVRAQLEPGVQLRGPHPAQPEQEALFVIIDVNEQQVLLSANHPLAGRTLHFAVEVVAVREAAAEEIEHGHVHGAGGHHH